MLMWKATVCFECKLQADAVPKPDEAFVRTGLELTCTKVTVICDWTGNDMCLLNSFSACLSWTHTKVLLVVVMFPSAQEGYVFNIKECNSTE